MRTELLGLGAVVTALLLYPVGTFAQPQGQNPAQPAAQSQSQSHTQSQASSQANSSPSTTLTRVAPVDPLAAAARKAREQRKDQSKTSRVFDNDNIPKQGGISSVGAQAPAGSADNGASATDSSVSSPAVAQGGLPSGRDEKGWRDRFGRLRHKLEEDQAELAIMQRELGVLDVQYYNDPMQGMQQELTRSDINEKTDKIEAKKKQIEADEQGLSDAEDQLRQAGGDPGWAR
jgi:hypothetical protein